MAKNYSIAEAVQIIAENQDTASITDLGKRYPLLTNMIARVAVLAGDEFVAFASYLPEHVSANKVNKAIKDAEDAAEVDDDEEEAEDGEDDEEVEEEAPKKSAKKAKEKAPEKKAPAKKAKKAEPEEEDDEDGDESDYDNMSNKELWNLLGEVGGRKKCREEFGDTKTADMIKYFKKYYPNGVDAEQPEEAEEEEADQYAGKSAVELYKMCKSRKIKAEQKKPSKYYIDLLKKADAAEAAAEAKSKKKAAEAEDEEWDNDEEEEEPAPKKQKKEAKAEKKPAKKAAKEEVEEEDEDDDWEI